MFGSVAFELAGDCRIRDRLDEHSHMNESAPAILPVIFGGNGWTFCHAPPASYVRFGLFRYTILDASMLGGRPVSQSHYVAGGASTGAAFTVAESTLDRRVLNNGMARRDAGDAFTASESTSVDVCPSVAGTLCLPPETACPAPSFGIAVREGIRIQEHEGDDHGADTMRVPPAA